ncbi:hypothetical protein GW17_00027698 [Ensete ventricosum]|nr:hypothetical protein GW17_00027698 [Ensete ventricosum]
MEVYPATLAGSSFGSHDVANRTGDGGASKPLFLPFEHSDALENRSRTGQNATWHRTYDAPCHVSTRNGGKPAWGPRGASHHVTSGCWRLESRGHREHAECIEHNMHFCSLGGEQRY